MAMHGAKLAEVVQLPLLIECGRHECFQCIISNGLREAQERQNDRLAGVIETQLAGGDRAEAAA